MKGLRLANRLVMAPMVSGLALDNAPTEAQIQWYRVRARGGVALVVVESAAVAADGTTGDGAYAGHVGDGIGDLMLR